jgi:hypothetical protein
MKRFLALLMVSTTLLGTCVFGAETTRYVYNGTETSAATTAIFKDGYTYLPIAQVGKALGYYVVEKAENNSVTVMPKGKAGYVSVFLGKQTGRMNGQNITLGKAPFSEDGVIYVSSKFIEEQLGVNVGYDSSKNTMYINSAGEGKITSTVSKVPVATASNPTASTSSAKTSTTVASTSSGSIATFTDITGVKVASTSNGVYTYNTGSLSDIDKYASYLEQNGFQLKSINGDFNITRIYQKGSKTVTIAYFTTYSISSSYTTGNSNAGTSYGSSTVIQIKYAG